MVEDGYEFFARRQLVTIFSAVRDTTGRNDRRGMECLCLCVRVWSCGVVGGLVLEDPSRHSTDGYLSPPPFLSPPTQNPQPNYCGEFDNAGAMMSVDETLMCSFQVGR